MKKKLWCVLCIMICMMMIAACGQKKNPEKKKSEKAEQEETVNIVKTKRFAMKPMDAEEACVQMELLGHNFFMFLNADTNEVNVVYKRKGNSYGLIEPEF